jgi:ribosomal protein S3
VSLLLSEGHQYAAHYPLAVVWSEVRIVRQRHANRIKLDAARMQMIIGSVFDKKASKRLQAMLKKLHEND